MENIFRMRGALAALPFISPEHETLMSEWMNQMLSPMENAEIFVKANSNLSETTWKVKMDTKTLAQRYAAFMKHADFKPVEIDVLKKGLTTFKGDFSVWLSIGKNEQDSGWEIDNGVFPLEQLWGLIPGNVEESLKKWYKKFDADAFVKFGRCIASNTYSYFNTELFGNNAEEDMELYISLCNALEIDPLPNPLLEMIADFEPEYTEVSFWIGSNGLLKLSLIIPDPSEELILKTALLTGDGDIDMIAAYEGALGDVVATKLEISRTANGIESSWEYRY
jgi:hypothetical protein